MLKKISHHQRFYNELIRLREQLDLLIRDYQATLAADENKKPIYPQLINPYTGKPHRKGKRQ
jgi:hypothetical protein